MQVQQVLLQHESTSKYLDDTDIRPGYQDDRDNRYKAGGAGLDGVFKGGGAGLDVVFEGGGAGLDVVFEAGGAGLDNVFEAGGVGLDGVFEDEGAGLDDTFKDEGAGLDGVVKGVDAGRQEQGPRQRWHRHRGRETSGRHLLPASRSQAGGGPR